MIGRTLNHYEIIEPLGAGGMGEVYRALDTKLERDIAIKLLPEGLAADKDRLARFEREAKSLAALDHPNIVHIYTVESVGDTRFLTMQLVEGDRLADVIPSRGMRLQDLLNIAIPLADALHAAHDSGITHRDLKPANVMLDQAGRVMVLDFGLAKLHRPDEDVVASDLETDLKTEHGVVLGTLPYMSPEQAEGKVVDARSDLFSLGVMLYEMAVGERPFRGESTASIVTSILRDTPTPVTDRKAELPANLGRIIRRCLEKDPDRRIQSAKDLHNELLDLRGEVDSGQAADLVAASATPSLWRQLAFVIPVLAAAAMILVWVLSGSGSDPSGGGGIGRTIRPLTSFVGWEHSPNWSPDGSMITYTHIVEGDADLATLSVEGGEPHILTASSPADEFRASWSPDGSKIAYVSDRGTGTNVYWIPPTGGAERLVAETHIPFLERMGVWGGTLGSNAWSPDGQDLVFSRLHEGGDVGLWRVHLPTGEETQLTFPSPGGVDRDASWSFDGERIAFTRIDKGREDLALIPAEGGEVTLVAPGGDPAWFPDNRRLAFSSLRSGAPNIWEIDLDTKELRQLTFGAGADWVPAVARDGSIAYVQFGHQIDIRWIHLDTPEQEHERLTSFTGEHFGARVSPDGNRVVYYSSRAGNFDLWLLDRTTGQHRQLTDHPADDRLPDWSPDGDEIVFMSDRDGLVRLWVVQTETGVVRRLTEHALPWSNHSAKGQGGPRWSPDGSVIGYLAPEEGNAIWLVGPDGSDPRPSEVRGALSFGWYLDAQRAVYTRRAPDGSGLVELRVAHLMTGEDRLLRAGAIAEVAVSPEGSALTFIEAVSHFTMELQMLRLSATSSLDQLPKAVGEPQQLTFGEGVWHVHSGGWAPDGGGIVYSMDTDYGDIYVIEPER
jgi:Tol biopolymer transport system component